MASILVATRPGALPQAARFPQTTQGVSVADAKESEKSELELTTIARAFAYHKILAIKENKKIEDIYTDTENEYDEFDSDDSLWSDSDDYDEDSDDGEGSNDGKKNGMADADDDNDGGSGDDNDDADDDDDDDDDEDVERHLVKTTFDTALVLGVPTSVQVAKVCDNSRFRKGLWVVSKSELISELTELGMGFLSQTTYIALQAQLNTCRNPDCVKMKEKIKQVAPACDWRPFRDWALVAMSCQAAMDDAYKVSYAHTHLARAVALFCMALKKCLRKKHRDELFLPFLDGDGDPLHKIDRANVSNLIYWMARIQSQLGIGPRRFGRWNHHLLPPHITLPSIERASETVEKMSICKNRLWNLVNVSDRKQSDLPDIVSALFPYREKLLHKDHDFCTPSKCQWAQMDSTGVKQLHKCELAEKENDGNATQKADTKKSKDVAPPNKEGQPQAETSGCKQLHFPVELLETALEMGKSTAWLCKSTALSGPNDPYIAISHVWSDGTGVGVKNAGTVNKCLFRFFEDIATELKCKAVWWDAISIPKEPKARSKALNKMHGNYANAQVTVVHDRYLLKFPWKEDGSPCLALVLSTWFTRGWTALELSMSKKVIVLFKDPVTGARIMKDLDEHILAKSPTVASRAHWLATTLIQRLRKPIDNVGDLLAVLSPRSTSWVRDRTIISALLTGVPDCDFTKGESIIATKVLEYLGKIPYTCLFHGKPTMRDLGKYSWCAATLDDMPVDISTDLGGSSGSKANDYLDIDEAGAVEGKWRWRKLGKEDVKNLRPHGNDLAAVVKVDTALRRWNRCLLLRQPSDKAEQDGSLALLVVPISLIRSDATLKCRYIGAVVETKTPSKDTQVDGDDDLRYNDSYNIRIGGKDSGGRGMLADTADDLMDTYDWPIPTSGDDGDEESVHGDEPPDADAVLAEEGTPKLDSLPQWLEVLNKAAKEPPTPPTKLMTSLSLTEVMPPVMGDKHLLFALKSKNEEAVRYLVEKGIDLGSMDAEEILAALGDEVNEDGILKSVLGLKLFADILAEQDKLQRAIDMYEGVIRAIEETPARDLTPDGLLRLCYAKYSLGKTLLKRDPHYPPHTVTKVHRLLTDVMEWFNKRNMKRAEAEKRKQEKAKENESSKQTQDFVAPPLKRANTTMREKKEQEKEEEKAAVNQMKSEQRWYRLELNTAAELTLLDTATFDLENASKTYKLALNRFGTDIDGIAGFEGLWERRRRQSFGDKKTADERAADIYQRALKRFNTMFHKDHIIIAITSLHLGINYMLRSMFSQAEDHLERALENFQFQLCCPLDAKARAAAHHTHIEKHPIFGLVRYQLGLLSIGQQKFKEAQRHLEKTQSIVSEWKAGSRSRKPSATILELSAVYAFGNAELRRRRPNLDDAEQSFKQMAKTLPELRNPEGTKRLGFQAQLGIARVLLARGKPEDAILHCEKTIKSSFGPLARLPNDLDICEALTFLGEAYEENDQLGLAEARFKRALDGFESLQGSKDHDYLQVARQLGAIYGKNGKPDDAKKMLLQAYEGLEETVGSYHSSTLKASWQLGRLHLQVRDLPAAAEACERAHIGFKKIAAGEETRRIAETAQTLGDVYFEQAKLSKAKEAYEAAFKAFKAVATGITKKAQDVPAKSKADQATNVDAREPPITDKATLLASLDVAKVCALIRHHELAEKHFMIAVDGFGQPKRSGISSALSGFDAQLKLGSFYREQKRFKDSWQRLKDAHQGLLGLQEKELPESKMKQAKVMVLQAQLAQGELLLDYKMKMDAEPPSEDSETTGELSGVVDEDFLFEYESLVETAQKGLSELLGENDPLSLYAATVLGEMYMTTNDEGDDDDDDDDGDGGGGETTENMRGAKGEKLVLKVLNTYENTLRIARGHPKKLRVIEILIRYYTEENETKKLDEMKARLWVDLKEAYGVDVAAIIMDLKNVRRPARDDWDFDSDSDSDSDSDADSNPGNEWKTSASFGRGYGGVGPDVENEVGGTDEDEEEDDSSSWDSDSEEESDPGDDGNADDGYGNRENPQDLGGHSAGVRDRKDSAVQLDHSVVDSEFHPGYTSQGPYGYSDYSGSGRRQAGEYRADHGQRRQQQLGQRQGVQQDVAWQQQSQVPYKQTPQKQSQQHQQSPRQQQPQATHQQTSQKQGQQHQQSSWQQQTTTRKEYRQEQVSGQQKTWEQSSRQQQPQAAYQQTPQKQGQQHQQSSRQQQTTRQEYRQEHVSGQQGTREQFSWQQSRQQTPAATQPARSPFREGQYSQQQSSTPQHQPLSRQQPAQQKPDRHVKQLPDQRQKNKKQPPSQGGVERRQQNSYPRFELGMTQLSTMLYQVKEQQSKIHEFKQAQITWASDLSQKLDRYCQQIRQLHNSQRQTEWIRKVYSQLDVNNQQLSRQRTDLADSTQKEFEWSANISKEIEQYRQRGQQQANQEWAAWALSLNSQLEAARLRLDGIQASGQGYRQQQLSWFAELFEQLESHRRQIAWNVQSGYNYNVVNEIKQSLEQQRSQLSQNQVVWEQLAQATMFFDPDFALGLEEEEEEEEEVMDHQDPDDEDEVVFCPVCKVYLPGQEALKTHMSQYSELEIKHGQYRNCQAECPACSMNFPDQESCDRHVAYYATLDNQHRTLYEKETKCPVCRMGLGDTNGVLKHLSRYADFDEAHRAHVVKNRFQPVCDQCGKRFSGMAEFSNHLEKAHGHYPYLYASP